MADSKHPFAITEISSVNDPSSGGLFLVFYVDEKGDAFSTQVEADSEQDAIEGVVSIVLERAGFDQIDQLITTIFSIKIPSYIIKGSYKKRKKNS